MNKDEIEEHKKHHKPTIKFQVTGIDDFMRIPEFIISERVKQGITQSQMGKMMGLSQAQISRIEDDKFINESLIRITEFMKCLGYTFCCGEAKKPNEQS